MSWLYSLGLEKYNDSQVSPMDSLSLTFSKYSGKRKVNKSIWYPVLVPFSTDLRARLAEVKETGSFTSLCLPFQTKSREKYNLIWNQSSKNSMYKL